MKLQRKTQWNPGDKYLKVSRTPLCVHFTAELVVQIWILCNRWCLKKWFRSFNSNDIWLYKCWWLVSVMWQKDCQVLKLLFIKLIICMLSFCFGGNKIFWQNKAFWTEQMKYLMSFFMTVWVWNCNETVTTMWHMLRIAEKL